MNAQSQITKTLKAVMFSVIGAALIWGILLGAFVFGPGQKAETADNTLADAPFASEAEEFAAEVMAIDEDIELPVPGDGERLYCGQADFDGASKFYVAFVLSPQSSEIHDLTIYVKDLSIMNAQIQISGVSIVEEYNGTYPVGPGAVDIELGGSKIYGLVFEGNRASGEIEYVYTNYSTSVTQIPLGKASIQFQDITDREVSTNQDTANWGSGSEEAEAVPEPAEEQTVAVAETTGHVVFEGTDYAVTIGEISINEDGFTTVEVQSPGIGTTIPIRDGQWVVPVQAMITASGETIGWENVTTAENSLVFVFPTDQTPEQIMLYPFGSEGDMSAYVAFDAATKTLMP